MSMDRGFQKWLTKRGLQPATIAILQKESILDENTLKLLRQADLEILRSKHHLTMGQFALLRTAHGDLLMPMATGFETIGMEDVPPPDVLGGGGEQQGAAGAARSRKNSKGEKYKVDKKQSTKELLSDNLEKVAYRERKLQNVAETAERVMSSAEEYNRLASMLAEKKRRESGKGFFSSRQRSSSSSSMETAGSGKRASSTLSPDTYDHLDNLSPPPPHQPSQPGGRGHVQLEPGSNDIISGSSGVRERRGKDDRNGYRHQNSATDINREDNDGRTNCCTIL